MVKPAVYCCCSVVDELAAMIALETNTSWDRWEPDFCFGAYSGRDDSPRHNNINDELKHRGIMCPGYLENATDGNLLFVSSACLVIQGPERILLQPGAREAFKVLFAMPKMIVKVRTAKKDYLKPP